MVFGRLAIFTTLSFSNRSTPVSSESKQAFFSFCAMLDLDLKALKSSGVLPSQQDKIDLLATVKSHQQRLLLLT